MQFNRIALLFKYEDYEKAVSNLPVPTYRQHFQSSLDKGKVLIVYELLHGVRSSKQMLWIANIKQYMNHCIKNPFVFEQNYDVEAMESSSNKYTLEELQMYFQPIQMTYPKMIYPSSKNELYKNLCLYATRLHYNKILNLEMVMYASMKMNESLDKPYTYKELLKKTITAYNLIVDSKDDLKQKLSKQELEIAHKKGGTIRAKQKEKEQQKHINAIQKLIDSGNYSKPNGYYKVSAIAQEVGLHRNTVARLVKTFLCFFPFFFLYVQLNSSMYHNTIAKVAFLKNSPYLQGVVHIFKQ